MLSVNIMLGVNIMLSVRIMLGVNIMLSVRIMLGVNIMLGIHIWYCHFSQTYKPNFNTLWVNVPCWSQF